MKSRRDFLKFLGLGIGVLAVDPEELLWKKEKTIFVPPVNKIIEVSVPIIENWYMPGVSAMFIPAMNSKEWEAMQKQLGITEQQIAGIFQRELVLNAHLEKRLYEEKELWNGIWVYKDKEA